jgi:hypothetical protein
MTLHLIKLSVGTENVDDLRQWQEEILARKRKAGQTVELYHRTLMMPKRRDEVLAGGSIYWVIRGYVRARQRIVGLEQRSASDGVGFCAILLDPPLIQTQLLSHRPFQGWRYLDPTDAPPDVGSRGFMEAFDGWDREPPPELLRELKDLGLI